ncbi:MAG: putative DNA-binding transcriptional regulator AlpA [Halioglobus sp.]|jgi:predicted DNA-binding transcriptional regulator AlpA
MLLEFHTTDDIKNIVVDAVRDALANFQPVKVSTPDDFLTKEDVAAMLQMSKSGIDSLRRRGLLKPYRIGASVRFKRSEIMTMLNSTNGRKQEAA